MGNSEFTATTLTFAGNGDTFLEAIDAVLADLEKKHGTKPNIIHIMWDDTALGEVGIPEIQKRSPPGNT